MSAFKLYKLLIDGGITDRVWCAEVYEAGDEAAVKVATSILRDSSIARSATSAALWHDDKMLAAWSVRASTHLVARQVRS